ncbi:lipopolysaccharide transport periplasmic protein LptA [Marinobacter confluentis]|uniref:Lipopolysaccharide export system protein LptA n=1 Tax=Marinobacter confluentis TaxID=1697557 RepID=A0A4Z1BJR2_9GAMM|nr:lipopolysaccharide transport periplasmic protein LptA [Marinobacter confluentis]TGN40007.1 lipopolysaccharide transport periplasmic protein LptA [Marinobacter confluentis]
MKPVINCSRQIIGKSRKASAILPLLLVLFAPVTGAFELDSDTPIRVSADNARLDDSQGIATYTGDVEMSQGNILLTADRVVLHRSENGVSRIEANGQPARYNQPAVEGQGETTAQALNITWSADDNRVTFEREAVIEQDGNLFRGDLIHYDSVERVVTAEGSADQGDGGGRVEMVIQPRNSRSSENGQEADGSSESQ